MFLTDQDINRLRKGVQHRLTIDGKTESHQSYLVPIEGLYFNDLNGRISTYIEENDSTSDPSKKLKNLLNDGKLDEYNDIIAGFIKKSANDNDVSFKKTKNDIKANGQKIPGVILRNGRIIDGNRRFTCLRELFKETGDTQYAFFECVILDVPETKEQMRSIKLLELNIQFNVDEKKDYNRIDFLVSFYRDTMDASSGNVIDKKTYCLASGLTKSDYDKNKLIVETMMDYLEWRGSSGSFYILKNEKLDGPIEEIARKRKKWTQGEWNEKKTTIYTYMSLGDVGDRTRDIRAILNSANNGDYLFNHLKENIENPAFMREVPVALKALETKPTTVDEDKAKKELLDKTRNALIEVYKSGSLQESIQKDADGPKKALNSALTSLNGINSVLVGRFSSEKKEELLGLIQGVKDALDRLEKSCKN